MTGSSLARRARTAIGTVVAVCLGVRLAELLIAPLLPLIIVGTVLVVITTLAVGRWR